MNDKAEDVKLGNEMRIKYLSFSSRSQRLEASKSTANQIRKFNHLKLQTTSQDAVWNTFKHVHLENGFPQISTPRTRVHRTPQIVKFFF